MIYDNEEIVGNYGNAWWKQKEELEKAYKEASKFKKAFEKLLYDVISCSEGVVDDTIFKAGEVVTEYTLPSEVKTSHFTGSDIDENITKLEVNLWKNSGLKRGKIDSGLVKKVERINQRCL